MIADVDAEGAGTIGFDDFLVMMTAKMAERDPREEILKAFRLFDDEESGKITFKNLKRVAKELGENISGELEGGGADAGVGASLRRRSELMPARLSSAPSALADEELQEMIDEADRDGDGEVSEEEFFRIMKKSGLF